MSTSTFMGTQEVVTAEEGYDADVVVVGLGPTGLTTAHCLASRGIKVIALEREPEFYGMARAVFTDGECLRIMQSLGLADELHSEMLHDLRVRWVGANGEELGWFHDPSTPQGWPTANFFYQPAYEQTLEQGLRRYAEASVSAGTAAGLSTDASSTKGSIEVRRGRAVTAVHQDASRVSVEHEACTGTGYGRGEDGIVSDSRETIRAKYVVACDGGRSVIRRQLGIEMKGTRFPQRWLVVDLQAPDGAAGENPFAHLQTFDFVCDPELPTVSCPQPQHRHRFEFMLHDDDVTEDFQDPAKAAELIERYCEPGSSVITRQLVYTFNALMAQSWREGRIFLAGDAAHMTPQFVGQGMNSGLRDAYNLSWKLAEVLRGEAPESLLESYEPERRPHAAAMMAVSVFNKDIVSTARPALIRLRDTGLRVAVRTPGLKTVLTEAKILPRPRYRRGAYFGMARRPFGVEGTLMPQPRLVPRSDDARTQRFDDVVGNGWLVVGLGTDPQRYAAHLAETGRSLTWVRLDDVGATDSVDTAGDAHVGTAGPGTASDVADVTTANVVMTLRTDDPAWQRWRRRAGLRDGTVLVVRPDKFVFGVIRDENSAVSVSALLAGPSPLTPTPPNPTTPTPAPRTP